MLNAKTSLIFLASIVILFTLSYAEDPPTLTGPYLGQKPPGDAPVLFAPGIVSTGLEHSAAMFTPDGKEVWFGRMFPEKIYYMKMVEGVWTGIRVAPFCDTLKYLYPVLIHGGMKIFFSSNRPVDRQGKRLVQGGRDIWMVQRSPDGWTAPEHQNDNINIGHRNSCGSMAANGNLYFTCGGNGSSTDMYHSRFVDNTYAVPVRLSEINSGTPDHCPFVAPNESYLIFSSFRGGLGRSDLFICFRNQDGAWTDPKNMGPVINSAYKDEYPFVTSDGEYLFFNSNRPSPLNAKPIPDGPGNIYWVSAAIIEKLR